MTPADMLSLLMEATVATSFAVLLVLVVRRPLRQAFGARIAYGAWALVPAALVAILLPAVPGPATMVLLPVLEMPAGAPGAVAEGAVAAGVPDPGVLIVVAWLAGIGALAWLLARRQRRFNAALGRLRARDGGLQAESSDGLPAVVGWWRPTVVLPVDFETRYDEAQRALVLAHERAHIARGDLHANAVVALLRCLFWFNPLLHWAADRFRHDQELACDACVLARHPRARRVYGEALLQAHCTTGELALGCRFGFGHPLKERIAMLGRPIPSSLRWFAGIVSVGALVLASGVVAWAAQPASVEAQQASHVPRPPSPPTAPVAPAAPIPDVPPTPHPAPAPHVPPSPPAPPTPPLPPPPTPPPPPGSVAAAPAGSRLPAPNYPAAARKHNLSGNIVLLVDVAADGSVIDAVVERSEPKGVFDEAALKAVKDWKFSLAREAGTQAPSRVRVPVEFKSVSTPIDGEEAARMVEAWNEKE